MKFTGEMGWNSIKSGLILYNFWVYYLARLGTDSASTYTDSSWVTGQIPEAIHREMFVQIFIKP